MSLCLCAYRYIPKHSHARNSTQTHTHIWETHQSLLQSGSSGECVCIQMDVCYMCIVASILNNFLRALLKQDAALNVCVTEANS